MNIDYYCIIKHVFYYYLSYDTYIFNTKMVTHYKDLAFAIHEGYITLFSSEPKNNRKLETVQKWNENVIFVSEILDTREEVIFQLHSIFGRLAARLELLEK